MFAKILLLLACSDSRSNSRMAKLNTLGENALAMNASGNMHPGFADVLLKLQFFSKGTRKVESNLKTLRHAEYHYSTLRGCQSCVTSFS